MDLVVHLWGATCHATFSRGGQIDQREVCRPRSSEINALYYVAKWMRSILAEDDFKSPWSAVEDAFQCLVDLHHPSFSSKWAMPTPFDQCLTPGQRLRQSVTFNGDVQVWLVLVMNRLCSPFTFLWIDCLNGMTIHGRVHVACHLVLRIHCLRRC